MTFTSAAAVFVEFALCVLVADFITGLVHWWEDAYAHLGWPEPVRSIVVEPNILHHEEQAAFLNGTWLTRCRDALGAAVFVCLGAWLCGVLTWHWIVVGVVAGFGNETHAWTHRRAPWGARLLQEMGILTTPQQHARHHKPPYDRCYCTVTNFLNPLLDASRFWRAVELMLAVIGVPPRRLLPERRGV